MRMVLACLLAACAGPAPCASHDNSPRGEQTAYTRSSGGEIGSVHVAPLQLCEHDWAYIRIERESGARRLGIARSSGGFDEGCASLPDAPDDPAQCPVIGVLTILEAAREALAAEGIETSGDGAGPCTTPGDEYATWNVSIGVLDWAEADRAVEVMAGLLETYDLAGYVGVAVRGIDCGVPLSGE